MQLFLPTNAHVSLSIHFRIFLMKSVFSFRSSLCYAAALSLLACAEAPTGGPNGTPPVASQKKKCVSVEPVTGSLIKHASCDDGAAMPASADDHS
jgi:hypothetical protein